MKLFRAILRLAGIAIFILLASKVDFSRVLNIFYNIDLLKFLAGIALIIPVYFIKAYKWFYILKVNGAGYRLKELQPVYYIGMLFGNFTPAKFGEFGKIFFLNSKKSKPGVLTGTVILDRAADLIMLLILVIFGLMYYRVSYSYKGYYALIIVVFAVLAILLIAGWKKSEGNFNKILNSILPAIGIDEKKHGFIPDIISVFYSVKLKNVLNIIFFTLLWMAGNSLQMYLFSRALGMSISYAYIFFVISAVYAVNVLPITIMGIGTRDMTLIYFLSRYGVAAEKSIALSSLILLAIFVVSAIGLACLLGRGKRKAG